MAPLHPPKPRLVLRVGITGHRPNKLHGAAVARIEMQLRGLFAAIDTAAGGILSANNAWYSAEPPLVRLVSGFAEGADQLAVAACPPAWQVEAVLPFPIAEYLEDFEHSPAGGPRSAREAFKECLKRASVVAQLPFVPSENEDLGGDSGKRATGYANAGSYLLRQIDLLIAVWDGKTPKTGGTGAVARQAYDQSVPVVWLSTLGEAAPHLLVGFEQDGRPRKGAADCTKGPLLDKLMPIFGVLRPALAGPGKASTRVRPDRFFQERWHSWCIFTAYDGLKRVAGLRLFRPVIQFRSFAERWQDWDAFLRDAPDTGARDKRQHEPGNLGDRVKSILLERFIWADALAEYYAHKYRTAYLLAYLLSAAAVFIALAGASQASHSPVVAWLELAAVVAILIVVMAGRVFQWHERWIDYRTLAENLRHGRFLAFVSEFGRIHAADSEREDRGSSWILWYVRATMREIGLPSATLDHTYQWGLLQSTLQHEIQGPNGQIAYHESNEKIIGRIDAALHRSGIACFVSTLAFLVVYIFSHWLGNIGLGWKLFWTAGLPALGAALAGIRAQGDFEGSAERSARMLDALGALENDYDKAKSMTPDLSLAETSNLLISTAHVMSEDVAAWQELYGRKWLNLPA